MAGQQERDWSKKDDADLKAMIRQFRPVKEVADVLDRSVPEVQRRLTELGAAMPGSHASQQARENDDDD